MAITAPWRGLAIAASLLFLVSVSWNVIQMRSRAAGSELADAIVTDHIRSLIGAHLLDVPSSDQHTVKPWFAGKLDFSPDVRELSAQGFPLVGGRVEYLEGRRVAALVYQRRQHVINLFIWPAGPSGTEAAISRNGYNLIHWTTGPMTYWAVSDANAADLATLRDLYK
jgi:anti-sigma factor RsiW